VNAYGSTLYVISVKNKNFEIAEAFLPKISFFSQIEAD
jgi:hypothetical protein